MKDQKFYRGEGCDECGGKGTKGRVGIYEVLPVTTAVQEVVTKKATSDEIKEQSVKEGMVTMLHDGLDKVASGLTTIEEVMRVVREG